ncbi:MAG: Hsp33 family molecular chaperone HslO [Oscillospiraceae bacterium]
MATLIRAISENGGIVVTALDSTQIVNEMQIAHHTSPVCSAALGRLLTGACLMGANLKSTSDVLTLRIKADGPAGQVVAIVNGKGNVKGYIENPFVDMPLRSDNKLNVGGAVGKDGSLYVIKDMGLKEPYSGQVPLVSGEIAEDITSYYAISEQTPNVCALGVLVNTDLSILNAGGYLLQLLPGATDEEISQIETNLSKMKSVTELLQENKTPTEIAFMLLDGFNPNLLDEQNVEYKCDCCYDKMERAVISLGRTELEKLRDEDDRLELCCQYCNKHYNLFASEILKNL